MKIHPGSLLISVVLVSACSEKPQSTATSDKPQHVWSTQVEALHQADEVAKFTQEQEKLKASRLRDLGVGDPQR